MVHSDDIVIGIDGGGTHTRVMISDLAGNVLSYVEKGGASIRKDIQAKRNVHEAIHEALQRTGSELHRVRGIAAGIAGYDSESDLEWVEPLTDVDGLSCPRWHINDAVVAHYGALLAQPGIVVISGTGSIILAITEDGRSIRNYDFHHYAASAARFIAYDAAYETLAGNTDETDAAFVRSMLRHWEVVSIQDFEKLGRAGFLNDRRERDKKFGQFAPAVTEAALQGSSTAKRVCDRAIAQIKVGVELLAASFSEPTVAVTFIGSVVNSPYFLDRLGDHLASGNNKRYRIVKPCCSPVTGAVLYAMNRLNVPLHDDLVRNLQKSVYSVS
ncbi:BadF/BadG/BcrA/BcrD ATPase family protein [Paenibacillus allorhizosphaerae]|uniref:N-acetylmuramic acid/N-acetylglucosamine kinase n=1 Tax=Paenibacillus allorhizosphaerae TaxID=2849866 RepID=A0ABN7TL41_9BACL|nr:BadF/BadG/BcrA/BcrD ATPase family protein [Paenibacillus allorhizosphaerae]CAG7645100.1 N-acetylmuramic acid/N-acetylglucosamine kinase [Paenibacillus allorhizosphaerae]